PVRVAPEPVKTAALQCLRRAIFVPVELAVEFPDLCRHGGPLPAVNHDEITGTTFDHLGFDRLQPDAIMRAILANSVHKDSAVSGPAFSLSAVWAAPFPLPAVCRSGRTRRLPATTVRYRRNGRSHGGCSIGRASSADDFEMI